MISAELVDEIPIAHCSGTDRAPLLWPKTPGHQRLPAGEVHVWSADLDQTDRDAVHLSKLLSGDELSRASRFYFERDRERFIRGRARLRILLSGYLDVAPERIRFQYGSNGKPRLAFPSETGLEFNVSHSGHLLLLAVALDRPVGIDVELLRPVEELSSIARQFFSAREVAELNRIPEPLQLVGFLNCWTRKEAILKAAGGGITQHLDRFSVALAPGRPPALIESEVPAFRSKNWRVVELRPATDSIAALAIHGGPARIRCWRWQGSNRGDRLN
jgi:4'-phosphopantetheinyl transferase